MQTIDSSAFESQKGLHQRNNKRRRADNETLGSDRKIRRLSKQPPEISSIEAGDPCQPVQLPSPSLTKTCYDHIQSPSSSPFPRKRKAKSLDYPSSIKRTRLTSEPAQAPSPIDTWLSQLPRSEDFEPLDNFETINNMSQPPSKRSRSSDSLGRALSQSGDGTETTISREKKYSVYKDVNYPVVLETKGSFMRPSKAGMLGEDKELCQRLLTHSQPIPYDVLFDDEHFERFHSNLRGRSEARVCVDLHPRIVPSVENLYINGREEFEGLIEGHNDSWVKSIPFYGPRPQPDHTFGFKWSNFTEQQRRKMNIEPTEKSYYTAREDIYFPFLTSEVKCGKQGLDLADRPNAHSMTIALRAIVDIYRKAGRSSDVHRRALTYSISHDDNGVRIYAHYPEIDGDKITFWRETLKEYSFGSDKGREKWTCYQFTLNVCEMFALPFIKRLKLVIDELSDPTVQPLDLATALDDVSVQASQDDASAPDSQDESFKKPRSARGLNVELRNMIQSLQRQLEQQREDSEQRRKEFEQQRKEFEQQRKESEQQQNELMKALTEQSTQIKELLQKR
ncbi:hypothetical protein LTR51_008630 [Lithohypha guttulata]|nr:hypothetical protein LTR51_008630 [Lithohypha guttulata]